MTSDEQKGVKAIIELQALAGIEETELQALKHWREMPESDRRRTMEAHETMCAPGAMEGLDSKLSDYCMRVSKAIKSVEPPNKGTAFIFLTRDLRTGALQMTTNLTKAEYVMETLEAALETTPGITPTVCSTKEQ